MKKALGRLFLLLMLLWLCAGSVWAAQRDVPVSGQVGQGLVWRIRNGTLTISGNGEIGNYEPGMAPWYEIRGDVKSLYLSAGVTAIGNNAFAGFRNLTRIVFFGSCPSIGETAFSQVIAHGEYPGNESGWTEETLQNYGGTLVWSAPCAHEYITAVAETGCLEQGYTLHRCRKCGEMYIDDYQEPVGHQMTEYLPEDGYRGEVRSVCHRGSSLAPENTLMAFELAKKQGFEYVETDVQFTRDGVAVLLHDDTIDRTSNGSGYLKDYTYEELKELDFGGWLSEEYAGTVLPTFEEFLQLCSQLHLKPYVELKAGVTTEQVTQLIRQTRRYGMTEQVTWISFDPELLRAIGQCQAGARLGYLISRGTEQDIQTALELQELGQVFLDVNYKKLTDDLLYLASSNGLSVEVWTVNDPDWFSAIPSYVTGVTSDFYGAWEWDENRVQQCLWCDYTE